MFKFRDKYEKIGIILGTICFVPSYIIVIYLSSINMVLGFIVLAVSQLLWLTSITLCTWSLEIENRTLKAKIENKQSGSRSVPKIQTSPPPPQPRTCCCHSCLPNIPHRIPMPEVKLPKEDK